MQLFSGYPQQNIVFEAFSGKYYKKQQRIGVFLNQDPHATISK